MYFNPHCSTQHTFALDSYIMTYNIYYARLFYLKLEQFCIVKIHTLLNYDGHLSTYVNITNGKTTDNKVAYQAPVLKGSVIVADWFYNDFLLLNIGTATVFTL